MWIESQTQSHGIVIGLDQIKQKKNQKTPPHTHMQKKPHSHTQLHKAPSPQKPPPQTKKKTKSQR